MNLQHLYQTVYEHPADDAARLVLADALLECGDPHGELIVLQFETHAIARKRAAKLVRRYRSQLLGPLRDVVVPGTDVWERGFLVACAARLRGDTTACPAWATVRQLGVVGAGRWEPTELGSVWMRSLREVRLWAESATGYWARQQELERLRVCALRVLSESNRLRLLKA